MKRALISHTRWIFGYTVFVVCGILFLLISFFLPRSSMYTLARWLSRSVIWSLGGRLQVEGTFPEDRAYIFMANHASFMDPFILGAVVPGHFTGVMAEEIMNYPLWSWILRRMRAIPIRRNDLESAIASVQIAEERLHDGYHIGYLPEGTRTLDGKLGPFKKGGFHMAINTRAPILPIGIEGAYRLKPKGSQVVTPGPVIVRIGTPIQPELYKNLSMEELMDKVRSEMLVLTGEVAKNTRED